jgi:hypothetical protein
VLLWEKIYYAKGWKKKKENKRREELEGYK